MKAKKIYMKLLAAILLCGAVGTTNATIILSGDGNITSQLGVVAGNDQFFANVLQGGNNVLVQNGYAGLFGNNVNNYYNGLGGVTSSMITSGVMINDAMLAGTDLFVSILPENSFTNSEINSLNSFLSTGGTAFFLGENSAFDIYNGFINNALSNLGSGMSITLGTTFDPGFHTATGSQIEAHSLTNGVTEFSYAAPNEVMVNGGQTLFRGTDGQAFVSVESVPEPTSLVLLGFGLAGFGFMRKRKTS